MGNHSEQNRERKLILDLLKNGYLIQQLFNSGLFFKWLGVDIPMNYFGDEMKGDIDFIAALTNNPVDGQTFYPVIEVKTIRVNKNGEIKSPKIGNSKIKKITNQLEKMVNFGCGLVALKEFYLIEEGGFKEKNILAEHIQTKMKLIVANGIREGIGYYPIGIESFGHLKLGGGTTIHSFRNLPMRFHFDQSPFREFTQKLEQLFFKEKTNISIIGFPLIIYCRSCRKLVVGGFQPKKNVTLICTFCAKSLEI